jgi:hypothetical protein
MDIPFELKVINTIHHWRKEGFSNFRMYEKKGFEFGIKFNNGEYEGITALKTFSNEEKKIRIEVINNVLAKMTY